MKNWQGLLRNLDDPLEPILNEHPLKGTQKKTAHKYDRYNRLISEEEIAIDAEYDIELTIITAKKIEHRAVEELINWALEMAIVVDGIIDDLMDNIFEQLEEVESFLVDSCEEEDDDLEGVPLEDSSRQRSSSIVLSLRAVVEMLRLEEELEESSSNSTYEPSLVVLRQNFMGDGGSDI